MDTGRGSVHNQGTILIVDDEPVGRDTLEALLVAQGYELAFAGDGLEALAKAQSLTPDLVLLDVMMPDMDGFEVCRRLRADPLLAEVPVIMVTALDDRDSRLQGIEAGADDFVTKPYDRVELRARVQTTVRLNRYRRLLVERMRFQWVVEHAGDGYLLVDDRGWVRYANTQARLYLNLPPRELTEGSAPGEERVGEFLGLARAYYRCEPQRVWETWPDLSPGEHETPLYLVRPESSAAMALWLRVEVFDLPGQERVIRLSDVTDEIAMQRDIRGFHEVIRHKVRTPLLVMLNSLELMTGLGSRMSQEDVTELAAAALKGTRRLRQTFEDVLAYLDAPGLAAPDQRYPLSQLEQTVLQIGESLGIERVRIFCSKALAHGRLPLSPRAVELVLYEILENTVKFHPEHTPAVDVAVLPDDGGKEAVLSIADDGVSVSPKHLDHIWSPYYQGEKFFTGEAAGTGLGLSTVAALVWGVGGSCRAHNRTDRDGLVIELALPLAADEDRN
jgi:two-component system cell cycle response regulator